jgi:hypothetical protein
MAKRSSEVLGRDSGRARKRNSSVNEQFSTTTPLRLSSSHPYGEKREESRRGSLTSLAKEVLDADIAMKVVDTKFAFLEVGLLMAAIAVVFERPLSLIGRIIRHGHVGLKGGAVDAVCRGREGRGRSHGCGQVGRGLLGGGGGGSGRELGGTLRRLWVKRHVGNGQRRDSDSRRDELREADATD